MKLLTIRDDSVRYIGNNILNVKIDIDLVDQRDIISYNQKIVDNCLIELRIYNILIGQFNQPIKKEIRNILCGGSGGPIEVNFSIDQWILREIKKQIKKDIRRPIRKYVPVDIKAEFFFASYDIFRGDPFTDKNLDYCYCDSKGMLSEYDWIKMNCEMDYKNWIIIKTREFLKEYKYMLSALIIIGMTIFFINLFIGLLSIILTIGIIPSFLTVILSSSILGLLFKHIIMKPKLKINTIPETDYIFFKGHRYRYIIYKIIIENIGKSTSENCEADVIFTNGERKRLGWDNFEKQQNVMINKKRGSKKINFCAFFVEDFTIPPGDITDEKGELLIHPKIIFSDNNGWPNLSSCSLHANGSFVNGIIVTSKNSDPVIAIIDVDIDKRKIDIFPCNYKDLDKNAQDKIRKTFNINK